MARFKTRQHRKQQHMGEVKKLPIPEVLPEAGGSWEVRTSAYNSFSDLSKRIMAVPEGDEPHTIFTQLHEMGHVRWSPKSPSVPRGIEPRTLAVAEDLRINHKLAREVDGWGQLTSVPLISPSQTDYMKGQIANSRSKFEDILLELVSTFGTGSYSQLVEALEKAKEEASTHGDEERVGMLELAYTVSHQAHYELTRVSGHKRGRNYADTRRVAAYLQNVMNEYALMQEAKSGRKLTDAQKRAMLKRIGTGTGKGSSSKPKAAGQRGWWGKMEIEPLRTNLPIPRIAQAKKKRAMDYGVIPRNMARWCTDRQIFTYTKRVSGGTVLIDASGSMSLLQSEIMDIVRASPAATVACYSGSGSAGKLRILVHDGKRVEDQLMDSPGGGGNIVDGPALVWLSEQAEPRYWVSDGYVTGSHECRNEAIIQDARYTQIMGDITRIERPTDAVKAFEKVSTPAKNGELPRS